MAITREKMIADVVQAMEDSVAFLPEDRREAIKEKLWGSLSARMFNMGIRDETETKRLQERQWVGLTATEIHDTDGYAETREMYRFALAIEAKLREKNCG